MTCFIKRLSAFRRTALVVALLAIATVIVISSRARPATGESGATVSFLDVGQGDATLLDDGRGHQVLVDGGPGPEVLAGLGRHMPIADREIELVVLTHRHVDHSGGLAEVMRRYGVDKVLMNGADSQCPSCDAFMGEVERQAVPILRVSTSTSIVVGDLVLKTLWPPEDFAGERIEDKGQAAAGGVNDTSIVLEVEVASSTVLLMADVSVAVEDRLLGYGLDLESDVLKVGHHGSSGSNSRRFLEAVKPSVAVVSAGAKNRYGLPTMKVMTRLVDLVTSVFRTDRDGDVVVRFGPGGVSARPSKP